MQFDEERLEGVLTIRQYDTQGFHLANQHYDSALVISPQQVTAISNETFGDTQALNAVIETMTEQQNDAVLILGTGAKQVFPDHERLRALMRTASGSARVVEVMDTGAACRTYNLLAGDGRAVIAALLLAGDQVS